MKSLWGAGLALIVFSVVVQAETIEEKSQRLEDGINRASEKGNFTQVEELRSTLAEYDARNNRFVDAARQYELLLAARPPRAERVKYFVRLGRMRDALQDYVRAIAAYQDALHDDRKSWDANLALARAYSKIELNTRAVEIYKYCIELRPKDPTAYAELGGVYRRMGYLRYAVTNYKKSIALQPSGETYRGLADAYVDQGDMNAATAVLQEARPLLPVTNYNISLGDIYRKSGRLSDAALAWEAAIASDPGRDDVRLKLALLYDRLGRRTEADHMLRDLEARYPDSPLVHFLWAWVLYDRGEKAAALAQSKQVGDLAPTELVAHFNERLQSEIKQ